MVLSFFIFLNFGQCGSCCVASGYQNVTFHTHKKYLFSFLPLCVASCFFVSSDGKNEFCHSEHLYPFSPLWVIKYVFILPDCKKDLSHYGSLSLSLFSSISALVSLQVTRLWEGLVTDRALKMCATSGVFVGSLMFWRLCHTENNYISSPRRESFCVCSGEKTLKKIFHNDSRNTVLGIVVKGLKLVWNNGSGRGWVS